MTKTKDTIEGYIRELKHLLALNGITARTENKSLLNVNLDRRADALSHAIQIALTAQEQAEGMLPEKKHLKVLKPERQVNGTFKDTFFFVETPEQKYFNQAISIATPVLAKKIKENEELRERLSVWKVEEREKRIEELEKEIGGLKNG